ncbi:MAG: hypothetical protein Q8O03_05340 [Nanoarchaeota archaeon]|nr:hypothetical protein [Nanoarchaeota archaeon]
MKLTKFKVLAASTALALSLLTGCYAKIEITRKPQYNESIKMDETVKKYRRLTENIIKYDKLVPGKDYAEERIMIGFDEGTTKNEANKFIENQDITNELEMLSYFSEIEWAVVKVPKGKEQACALFFQNMSDETIVDFAELDYTVRVPVIIIPKLDNNQN